MKRIFGLLTLTALISAQPNEVVFKDGSFCVNDQPVQRCLLDAQLKNIQTVEQFDSYTAQNGRFDVVRYGDNECGLVSNGSLNGGGPILGLIAWGVVKAVGLAPDAIARKVAKTKARKDEARVAHGEAPRHQNKDQRGVNKKVQEVQEVFDKLANAAQEYCNSLPTP